MLSSFHIPEAIPISEPEYIIQLQPDVQNPFLVKVRPNNVGVKCNVELFNEMYYFGYSLEMKNLNLFVGSRSKCIWNYDSEYDKEPCLFDLSTYERTTKNMFEIDLNTLTKMKNDLMEHTLMYQGVKILAPVVAICPFFNIKSMKDDRKERESRDILGLIHSSQNFSSSDPHSNQLSKAMFSGTLPRSLITKNILTEIENNPQYIYQPPKKIGDESRKVKINTLLDCVQAHAHSRFMGADPDKTVKIPMFYLIKKFEYNNGWPTFELVIF